MLLLAALGAGASWRALSPELTATRPQDGQALAHYLKERAEPGDRLISNATSQSIPDMPSALKVASAETGMEKGRVWRLLSLEKAPAVSEDLSWGPPGLQRVEERWFGNLYLALYEDTEAVMGRIRRKLDARLEHSIRLVGYDLASGGDVSCGGESVKVTLYWSAGKELEKDYSVSVQVLDAEGRLAFQHDSPPASNVRPTSGWFPGEMIRDAHQVCLSPKPEPGNYSMVVAMYDPEAGRLQVDGGGDVVFLQEMALP